MIAEKWGLSRDQLDEFSSASHAKLAAAIDEGRLTAQIAPVDLPDGRVFSTDEGLRRGTSPQTLAALKPAFKEGGLIHAGNSSQISDGAAALLMTALVYHMVDHDLRYGLQTMCEGGGMANATIIERVG